MTDLTDTDIRADLIDNLRACRAAERAIVTALDPTIRDAPGPDDGWSPKDAMFHVAAWCAEAARQLERMRLGTYVDPLIESDAQNRAWFDLSQELDVPTVRAELHAARTKMRQEWCELGEHGELTSDAVEWFEESGHIHYRDHRRELLAWLDRI